METTNPREQKALGRKVRGFDAAEWELHGYDVVVRGNYEKFRQNPTFLQRLLDTGDKILAEASPYDTEWGIGLHASDDNAPVQRRWQGKNKLGEALMEVRALLREEVHEAYSLPDSVGAFPGDAGEVSMEIDGGNDEESDEDDTIGEHRPRK